MNPKIKIKLGKVEAQGELFEKDAPWTSSWLLKSLPVQGTAMHSMENGREVFLKLDYNGDIKSENQTIYQASGDIIVYFKPAIFITPKWPKHEREYPVVSFIYERDSAIRGMAGPLATNLVGRITEGLDRLATEAPRMRREGFDSISISKA